MSDLDNIYEIEGFKMHLDPKKRGISADLLVHGSREPAFMWILRKEAKGDLGVDIGANIGYATLNLCKSMNNVIAIEPDQRCRKLLKRSLRDNDFEDKTIVYGSAISDIIGEKEIYLAKNNFNLNSLCDVSATLSKKDKFIKKTIKTITLDSMDIDPNFIKMDIEGYEVEALRGAKNTLRRAKNCKILIEVHPQYYDDKRAFDIELRDIISYGFKIKYLVSAGVSCPDLFKEKGYEPFKTFKAGEHTRGIFTDVSQEDAINFSSFVHKQINPETRRVSSKIVRSIFLVKGE